MKFISSIITCLYIISTLLISIKTKAGISSYLKIDLVEAVNLHCKLNNEFYCNPYAVIEFKYSTETKTTKSVECTKHPKWESQFIFTPEVCKDVVYINLFQYLTPRDDAYLDSAINEDENFEKGDYKPGYLGRVILELEKIPHGIIDDWFMVDSPSESTRIVFPSCVHLRISWTSARCSEPSDSTQYQIQPFHKQDFLPMNFIPMCKREFTLIYKTKFSRIDIEDQIKKKNEIDIHRPRKDKDVISACKIDSNMDFGFLHKFSNLTYIEEALVYKIIKRTTGENINYEEFTKEYSGNDKNKKYVKSYKEFFEKECFKRMDMTIERVNNILKNDAESFPRNTTNIYLNPELDKLDYTEKTNLLHLESVYKDTLNQFYAIEDIKNLKSMDDDSYIETLNKLTDVIKSIHAEKKIDETMFEISNKVLMTNEGLINPKEQYFFRIYALYKWNGGQYPYDEIKREFMLRRKYFDCYERVDMMPTNIIFQFIEDVCPNNYVCVDPNGIVINSVGRNPNEVFAKEIQETKLKFLEKSKYNNKTFRNGKNRDSNLRFRQDNSNSNTELDNDSDSSSKSNTNNKLEINKENSNSDYDSNSKEKINFEDLLKMETITPPDESSQDKSKTFVRSNNSGSHTTDPIVFNPYINKITYKNKFDIMYEQRLVRIQKKKEVIINKIFNHVPLLGEILSIANLGADKNKTHSLKDRVDQAFINREVDLLKKYLLLYNSDIPFVEQAAKILLDFILCNNDKTSIAYTLRELLEGLCYGDDRSIKIFEEIVRTVIIEALLIKPYYHFSDLHAKVNLLNTLNKPLCYKTITKIRFVEMMLMFDFLKEKITFIIYNNDTNMKIAKRIKETEISIPQTLVKNKRDFSLKQGNEFDDGVKVSRNYLVEMDRIKFDYENKREKEFESGIQSKNDNGFRFKSVKNEDDDILSSIKKIRNILDNEMKADENKTGLIVLEDFSNDHVKKLSQGYKNQTNTINYDQKQNIITYANNSSIIADDLMNEFKDFIDNNNKTNNLNHQDIGNHKDQKIEIKKYKNTDELLRTIKTQTNKSNSTNISIYHKSSDDFPKFKSLNSNIKKQFTLDSISDSDEFAKQSLNQFNNPKIYDNPEDKSYSILSTNKQPSSEDILDKIMQDKNSKNLIENIKTNPDSKIIYPKEIHTVYEVDKQGTKQITVNNNNPTKKLIVDKLMDEKSYNDLIEQEEKKEDDNDQSGLYKVLKNIQNRKCSLEFLCIEIGTIYGPFDSLKPKNVTIMTKEKENVHVIIKPIILVNNTISNKQEGIVKEKSILLDNDEDCDILKISNDRNMNLYNANMRFKQLVDKDVKQAKLKRKFYRKVEMGNEILATDIFKQGLNLIILKREKGYPKIFERTYSTNSDPIESDAMACVLRDAAYDKIIIITGIGKWMGAITPRLVKEIKQIGGPNLNYLVTSDGEDNSMADHSFILIGRRGLCRYNGIFRVKNYDVSSDMKKYFPDLSSDPNDCYFDDISYENEKNKNKENTFFHLVDLRLTSDLSNDSRFSLKAPVITNVFPNSGPLNGGQIIKIRGFNFGTTSLDIKEVLVRGVICRNVELESPFLITCVSGSSTIMGPGIGNIQVKLLCGLSSPQATCSMYQYTSEMGSPSIINREDTPINFNTRDDRLPSIKVVHTVVAPHVPVMTLSHPIPPHILNVPPHIMPAINPPVSNSIFARRPSLFSFKEKLSNESNANLDEGIKMNTTSKNENVDRVNDLVSDNYKHILSQIESNKFTTHRDGFRKRRFKNIFEKLK